VRVPPARPAGDGLLLIAGAAVAPLGWLSAPTGLALGGNRTASTSGRCDPIRAHDAGRLEAVRRSDLAARLRRAPPRRAPRGIRRTVALAGAARLGAGWELRRPPTVRARGRVRRAWRRAASARALAPHVLLVVVALLARRRERRPPIRTALRRNRHRARRPGGRCRRGKSPAGAGSPPTVPAVRRTLDDPGRVAAMCPFTTVPLSPANALGDAARSSARRSGRAGGGLRANSRSAGRRIDGARTGCEVRPAVCKFAGKAEVCRGRDLGLPRARARMRAGRSA
jgi:hypothetical protein